MENELDKIDDAVALNIVAQMLKKLLDIHEEVKGVRDGRRPSYEEAQEEAAWVVGKLRPSTRISGLSGPDSEKAIIEDDPGIIITTEETASELYRSFWLKEVPKLSIEQYLERHHRYCRSSAATYLTAGRLIYQLAVERQAIPVTRLNVYRLFCAAFVVASKFIEDVLYPMNRYAITAGVQKRDLAKLEVSLLLMLDFDIKVDANILQGSLDAWATVGNDNSNT